MNNNNINNKSLNPDAPEFIPLILAPTKAGDSVIDKVDDLLVKDLLDLLLFTESPNLKKIYQIMTFVAKKNNDLNDFLTQMFIIVLPLSENEKKRSGDVIAILNFRIEDPEAKSIFEKSYKSILFNYYIDCCKIIDKIDEKFVEMSLLTNFLELLSIFYTQTIYRDVIAIALLLSLLKKVLLKCDERNVSLVLESLRITHKLTDVLIMDLEKLKRECQVPLSDDSVCPATMVEILYQIIREKIVNRFFGTFSKECLEEAIKVLEQRARAAGRHKSFLAENSCPQ